MNGTPREWLAAARAEATASWDEGGIPIGAVLVNADGVIVGSAFIRRVLDAESSAEATAEVGRFAAELREGVGRSTHLSKPDA